MLSRLGVRSRPGRPSRSGSSGGSSAGGSSGVATSLDLSSDPGMALLHTHDGGTTNHCGTTPSWSGGTLTYRYGRQSYSPEYVADLEAAVVGGDVEFTFTYTPSLNNANVNGSGLLFIGITDDTSSFALVFGQSQDTDFGADASNVAINAYLIQHDTDTADRVFPHRVFAGTGLDQLATGASYDITVKYIGGTLSLEVDGVEVGSASGGPSLGNLTWDRFLLGGQRATASTADCIYWTEAAITAVTVTGYELEYTFTPVATETFNTADGAGLGPDQSWTVRNGSAHEIVSNAAAGPSGGALSDNRMEVDAGSDDMYVQTEITQIGAANFMGIALRMPNSATRDHYAIGVYWSGTLDFYLTKRVSGTQTVLATLLSQTRETGTLKLIAVGNRISVEWQGTEILSAVDFSHTTGKQRSGIVGNDSSQNCRFDDFVMGTVSA